MATINEFLKGNRDEIPHQALSFQPNTKNPIITNLTAFPTIKAKLSARTDVSKENLNGGGWKGGIIDF